MKNKLQNKKGMAAIFTVVVIGAASLILARSASYLSMSSLDTAFVIDKEAEVQYLTESCVEESLRRLQLNHDYIVTDMASTQDDGTCTISISSNGDERTIDVSGTVGEYHKTVTLNLTIINDNLSIKKWSPND